MGVCHQCKCFLCENLGTRKCPLGRVCAICYKGINSQNFKITHCDKYVPYEPVFTVRAAQQKPKYHRKPFVKKRKRTNTKKIGG